METNEREISLDELSKEELIAKIIELSVTINTMNKFLQSGVLPSPNEITCGDFSIQSKEPISELILAMETMIKKFGTFQKERKKVNFSEANGMFG